ncbi:hypothetical protein ACINLE_13025 [Bacillus sp. z60-18]|uniref:DUF7296 family protein n=1 Tax=unclassified Bacillus (in: firmicutes) TaxID=185979 RepID=UPI002409E398|nr:hypothetical protein [Bacillus sp. HSf4]WFA06688.1 hypothetical protein P3X63_07930 [Bacillus sp. HSf4]
MAFYEYTQNNSGGSFVVNEKVCHRLFLFLDQSFKFSLTGGKSDQFIVPSSIEKRYLFIASYYKRFSHEIKAYEPPEVDVGMLRYRRRENFLFRVLIDNLDLLKSLQSMKMNLIDQD